METSGLESLGYKWHSLSMLGRLANDLSTKFRVVLEPEWAGLGSRLPDSPIPCRAKRGLTKRPRSSSTTARTDIPAARPAFAKLHDSQSQRDCIIQPRVGPSHGSEATVLPWGVVRRGPQPPKAVESGPWHIPGVVQHCGWRVGRGTAGGLGVGHGPLQGGVEDVGFANEAKRELESAKSRNGYRAVA